jgi:DNA invertase Pin-like site-specific DNA recombinase
MSTDQQRYSIEYQLTTIRGYAAARGFELFKIYEDPGRSGLTLEGRPGLKMLLTDVLNGDGAFTAILVYDISRWGRFQDVDESAYYEHLCKRCGVRVIYCAEPFLDDSGPMTAVIKSVKRAMAGEYSRELSTKITAGLRIAAGLGHNNGGSRPYGLHRVLMDNKGKKVRVLRRGEWKGHGEGYVTHAPGPPKEVAVLRSIFRMYVKNGFSAQKIATALNERGVPTSQKGRNGWTQGVVNKLLGNEKYIGTQVYKKTLGRSIKGVRRTNRKVDWMRVPNAFQGIIDPQLFWRAQEITRQRRDGKTNECLLSELRDAVERRGVVPGYAFRNNGLSISSVYRRRFGSIQQAYAQIGVLDLPPHMLIDEVLAMRAQRRALMDDLAAVARSHGHAVSMKSGARFVGVDGLRCRLDLVRARTTPTGASRWRLHYRKVDFLVAMLARIDLTGTIIDFYVIPRASLKTRYLALYTENGAYFDQFRKTSLDDVVAAIAAIRKQ